MVRLIAASVTTVGLAACGGGGSATPAGPALPSFPTAQAVLDAAAAQVKCDQANATTPLITGADENISCAVGLEFINVHHFSRKANPVDVSSFARSTVCKSLVTYAYVLGDNWTAAVSVFTKAGAQSQDRALTDRFAAATGGRVTTLECRPS